MIEKKSVARNERVKILLTNDDGIGAVGLKTLASALKGLGEVWVVAPERPQSAVGRAMTLHKPLRLTQLGKRKFAVNGTPADCVTLAVGKLMERHKPDIIVSGINKGLNIGDDVTNSGTVSGAIEGMLHGIPSIAVSQDDEEHCRFQVAGTYVLRLAKLVLQCGLPKDLLLNMNVPNCPLTKIAGVTMTSLSQRRYLNPIIEKVDPRGRHYYWIAGERVSWQRKKTSDHEAVSNRMVSITPLHLDMTQYQALKALRTWESTLNLNSKSLVRKSKPRDKAGSKSKAK